MSEYTPGLWWHTWGSVWADIAVVHKADIDYMTLTLGMRAKYGLRRLSKRNARRVK